MGFFLSFFHCGHNPGLTELLSLSPLLLADVLISRLSVQRVLEVSPEWTEDRHVLPQNTSMEYDIRVTCDSNYYGGGCADLCRPRDDGFGHYTCSSNGDIVCLSGWQGQYCTKRKYHRRDTATQNGALLGGTLYGHAGF